MRYRYLKVRAGKLRPGDEIKRADGSWSDRVGRVETGYDGKSWNVALWFRCSGHGFHPADVTHECNTYRVRRPIATGTAR